MSSEVATEPELPGELPDADGVDDSVVETVSAPPSGAVRTRRQRLRRAWKRKPIKKATIWTHRWTSLVLGLVLLVITTTGVPILWDKEIMHQRHAAAYAASGPPSYPLTDVPGIVKAYDATFTASALIQTGGVYVAENYDTGRRITVDPASRTVLGDYVPADDKGVVAWVVSLSRNVHECALTCEDDVGYVAWMNSKVPGTSWAYYDGERMPVSALLLAVTGLLLLFLALSGIWLWWPGIKKFATGVRVRFRKGRYSRDFDLHQVVGMVAVPLLLLWAFTGMGFESQLVSKAWYAVLPGSEAPEVEFASKESKDPDISAAQAVAIAQQKIGSTTERPSLIDMPAADDATATYGVWFQQGIDPWAKGGDYPGDLLVSVDRHGGASEVTYGNWPSTAQHIHDDWFFTLHAAWAVGPWWRIIWAVFGLVPLLLAFTGLSTWLYKRGLRKRRRRAATAAPAAG